MIAASVLSVEHLDFISIAHAVERFLLYCSVESWMKAHSPVGHTAVCGNENLEPDFCIFGFWLVLVEEADCGCLP